MSGRVPGRGWGPTRPSARAVGGIVLRARAAPPAARGRREPPEGLHRRAPSVALRPARSGVAAPSRIPPPRPYLTLAGLLSRVGWRPAPFPFGH